MPTPWILAWYTGHDASAALVSPERIIHLEKERFTRVRHDGGEVESLFSIALEQAGIPADVIVTTARVAPDGDGKCWGESPLDLELTQRTVLGRELPHYYLPHHLAHAAYAFYTSPFSRAAVVTMDGGGDDRRGADGKQIMTDGLYGWAEHGFGQAESAWALNYSRQPSIGHEWNRISSELFGDGGTYSAGKVMALGGVDPLGFEARTRFPLAVREQITQLQSRTNAAMVAAVAQTVTPHEQYDLVLGGGVALNGLAVAHLQESSVAPRSVHVPPAVNDGGLSVGAAFYVLHALLKEPRHLRSARDVAFCGYLDPELSGIPDVSAVVNALLARQTVALVHGPAESGPRALGHRSLIALPSRRMKDRLNAMKERAAWRPCAPTIHLVDADDTWFLLYPSPETYRFMTAICEDGPGLTPFAALHDDGTARVQVVDDGDVLGTILSALQQETGFPMMLLNTSLNTAREAMPNTRAQALDTCQRLGVDVAFLGSDVVRKS